MSSSSRGNGTSDSSRSQPPGHPRRAFLASSAALLAGAVAASTAKAEQATSIAAPALKEPYSYERDPLLVSTHPRIIKARDAALELLRPTSAQLQHGLELHRNSLVFDSYGFAPRASIDGDAVAAADAAGVTDLQLQDLRAELSMTRAAKVPAEREEFLLAMQTAGVTCIFQNAGEESSNPMVLLKRLAHFTYLGDMLRDVLVRATLPQDIEAARAAGQHCLYLTGNGVPLPLDPGSVTAGFEFVRLFFELGVRMMHLTYNRRNLLGDGCAEAANGGISDFGRAVIQEMNRVGVIVDVAHSGWQTSLEAAKASSKPMVASHTTCTAVTHHIRSKPDEVIRAICDTGGLIGICWIPEFIGGNGDLTGVIQHIDYAVKKFGIDHVAVGTDIAHTSQYAAEQDAKVKTRGRREVRFASLWPPRALGGKWPGAASLTWTNWPLLTVGLVQKGYSDTDIQKILGGNIMRVCKDVLS